MFDFDYHGIGQFLRTYQEYAKNEKERAKILKAQKMRAEIDPKKMKKKEEKDHKSNIPNQIETKSSSTSTPMLLQILQGHVPLSCLYGTVRIISHNWRSLSR